MQEFIERVPTEYELAKQGILRANRVKLDRPYWHNILGEYVQPFEDQNFRRIFLGGLEQFLQSHEFEYDPLNMYAIIQDWDDFATGLTLQQFDGGYQNDDLIRLYKFGFSIGIFRDYKSNISDEDIPIFSDEFKVFKQGFNLEIVDQEQIKGIKQFYFTAVNLKQKQ